MFLRRYGAPVISKRSIDMQVVEPLGYRPAAAAKLLSISRSTLWRLCRAHELEALRISDRASVVTVESINELIRRRREAAQAGVAK
jgi:hypothetical protein